MADIHPTIVNYLIIKGFCQVKKNQKIREKLGSGWVGQAPTRIFFFFGNFVLFSYFHVFPKKWIGGWLGGV